MLAVIGAGALASYYARKRKAREDLVSASAVDSAWALARERLGGTAPPKKPRSLEYAHRAGRSLLAQRDDAADGSSFVLCVVSGLPNVPGTHLSVQADSLLGALGRPFTAATGDPEFDRDFLVTAKPAFLAQAYFDAPTRAALRDSGSPLELGQGRLRLRAGGKAVESDAILRLAGIGEQLAARWGEMVAEPLRLASRLGFESTATTLWLPGTTLLGRVFRHGRSWLLEMIADALTCEIVLRTDHGAEVELRFPWPKTDGETITRAFAAKESELSAAYR